jgi:hypothetical protein
MPFQLVDDLLLEILDSAYQNDQHLPDYRLLYRFSLVSKAWGYEAQKRLFSEGLFATHHKPDPANLARLTRTLQSTYQTANTFIYFCAV